MTQSTKKTECLEEMSNDELLDLQNGFIAIRDHADANLQRILKIIQYRLEKNLIK